MKKMLINAAQVEELRVALVQQDRLYDLIVERAGFEQKVGNIYKARITSIEPSLDAVFVDYGSDRHGFLPLKEISREYFAQDSSKYSDRPEIRKVLRIGQELMIQVEKEERGNKGAALTTFISLAGSYLVLMPNNPRAGGISRRIEGEDRDELRENLSHLQIPPEMGLIVRTAGVGKSKEEIQWDLDVLLSHWTAIKNAYELRPAPFLIHQEGDLVIRAIRDYLRSDISELYVDTQETFDKAKNYIEQVRPDFLSKVKLFSERVPLFTHFGIEQQIESAYKRTVHLPSGGSIVIDHSEALVAIDINSAGSTKAENIEQTALNTNLEAAEEIARQLRLRDIGGLIVIDFIDMVQFKHQREVESALLNSLRLDRARVQISKISRFGLLELSRQRLRPSLRETIQHVCPTCNGHGYVRSVESIALSVIRIIEEEAMKPNTSEIQVQASIETATYILNEKRSFIEKIEQAHKVTVFVIPNPNLQQQNYDIKRLRRTESEAFSAKHKPSYLHMESPEQEYTSSKQLAERRVIDEPAVKSLVPIRPDLDSKAHGGLIKRLWSTMFGSFEQEGQSTESSESTTRTVEQPSESQSTRQRHPSRSGRSYRGQDSSSRQNRDRDSQHARRGRSRGNQSQRDPQSDSDRRQSRPYNSEQNRPSRPMNQEQGRSPQPINQEQDRAAQSISQQNEKYFDSPSSIDQPPLTQRDESKPNRQQSRRRPSDSVGESSSPEGRHSRPERDRNSERDRGSDRGRSRSSDRGNERGRRRDGKSGDFDRRDSRARGRKPVEPGKASIEDYTDFEDYMPGNTIEPPKTSARPARSQPISHSSQIESHPPIQKYEQEQQLTVIKASPKPLPTSEIEGEPLVVRPKTKDESSLRNPPQEIKAAVVNTESSSYSASKPAEVSFEPERRSENTDPANKDKKITENNES